MTEPRTYLVPVMAVVVTLGFFGLISTLFYLSAQGIKLDDNSRDVLIYALGVVSSGWMGIVSYLFGSSASSRNKDAVISEIAKGKP